MLVMSTATPSIGDRLLKLRTMAGAGSRELSRVVGASPAIVFHLEHGLIATPGSALAIRLARALGASVEYLVLGEGDPPDADNVVSAWARASAALKATGTEG